MSEWQPIETAPKDGTPILAFLRGHCRVLAWLPHPDSSYPFAWKDPVTDDVLVRGWKDDEDPTHWMRLPAPPDLNNERHP